MASCEQEEMSIKVKLGKLHCPFTWEIQNSMIKHSILQFNSNDLDHDIIENYASCPLEHLINSLFYCYKAVLSADNNEAKKIIAKAKDVLKQIQQGKELHQTLRAIEHVFYATKCFVLYESEEYDQLEEILKNIKPDNFSNEELGALYGCQSVVWTCLYDFGLNNAIDTAKKAIEKNPDCPLWHFILGKNLRRQRRSINISSAASAAERKHFETAYDISNTKNEIFTIYYLQMRMESFHKFIRDRNYMMRKTANEEQVLQIAKEMIKTKTTKTNYKVLLKLALMFLRVKNVSDATLVKECLDAVKQIVPKNSSYLHYTAMYYRQQGNCKKAIKYFKKAAELNNFAAEISYVQYGWEKKELSQPLPYLLQMWKKYGYAVKQRQIEILLAIAIAYHSLYTDTKNAAEYFLKALTIDPFHQKFQIYYKFLDIQTPSISFFLNNKFCPLLENKNFREMSQKIKNLLTGKKVTTDDITNLTEEFENLCTNNK